MSGAVLSRFNAFYGRSYEKAPMRTLILANGVLVSSADVIAQGVANGLSYHQHGVMQPYDPVRTARFAVFGLTMAPFIGKWLMALEKVFPLPAAGGRSAVPAVVKRVIADQVVFAPAGLATFVTAIGLLEGKSTTEIGQKFKDVFWPALKTNWTVWPVIQAVNFSIVPLPYRLPFQQTCGVVWSTYLSLLNARQDRKAAAVEGVKEEIEEGVRRAA